jgi:hypothetical protein
VNNHFLTRRKGFKDFISMLSEKNKYDQEYAKGMKKIFDMNYTITNEGTLGDGMKYFRNHFFNLYQYYNDHSNEIKRDVIEPAKKFLDDQHAVAKKNYNDVKRLEKEYKEAINNVEKLKSKFLTTARNAELKKLDSELAKLSTIPQSDKDNFHSKSTTALKDAKDAEKQYITALNYANLVRAAYIEGSKTALHNFQSLEEEFIDFSKIILHKFFIFSNVHYKECMYETERGNDQIAKIDRREDVETFIELNQTYSVPPGPVEYVPYSVYLQSKPLEEFNYAPEVIYNVIVTLQSCFEKTNEYVSNKIKYYIAHY